MSVWLTLLLIFSEQIVNYVWPEPFVSRLVPRNYKYEMGLGVIWRNFLFWFKIKLIKRRKIFSTSPTKVNLTIFRSSLKILVDRFFYSVQNHQNTESQETQVCQSNLENEHNKNNTTEIHQMSIKIITFGIHRYGGFTIGVVGVQALKKANDQGMGKCSSRRIHVKLIFDRISIDCRLFSSKLGIFWTW